MRLSVPGGGGVHSFLNFKGTIILSTIMKDAILARLPIGDYVRIISIVKPDYCLTIDCETYEGESYWKVEAGIRKLCFDNCAVAQQNITRSRTETRQLMRTLPQQKFIGLVKGTTTEQVAEHARFFRSVGIHHMALHTADFFRNANPEMISKVKHYAQIVRKDAQTLTLIGFGSQKRLLEFSFADNYATFGHFVTARYGMQLVGTKKIKSGGYSPSVVRTNLIEMMNNVRRLRHQKQLRIGGEYIWGGGSSAKRVVHSGYAGTRSYNTTLTSYKKENDAKPKVFISFSMNDHAQVELLRHQVASDKYDLEFIDNSLKNPVIGRDWKSPVGIKIEQSDAVICMIGEDTYSRSAVSWELKTAYKNNIPVIPVRVHRGRRSQVPEQIRNHGDQTVPWNLDEIQHHIDAKTGGGQNGGE